MTLPEKIIRSKEVTKPLVRGIIKYDYTFSKEMKEKQLQAKKDLNLRNYKEKDEAVNQLQQTL